MREARLSIIIPTISRPTLRRTLQSLIPAGIRKTDDLIVIGDGPNPDARPIVDELRGKCTTFYAETARISVPGGPQRNRGMMAAFGDYLLFIDDDDVYKPGALDIVRGAIAENPGKIFVFRMESKNPPKHPWGPVLWKDKEIRLGNVGTPMFAVPNLPHRLGVWAYRAECDFDFLAMTVRRYPGDPKDLVVWREEILTEIY